MLVACCCFGWTCFSTAVVFSCCPCDYAIYLAGVSHTYVGLYLSEGQTAPPETVTTTKFTRKQLWVTVLSSELDMDHQDSKELCARLTGNVGRLSADIFYQQFNLIGTQFSEFYFSEMLEIFHLVGMDHWPEMHRDRLVNQQLEETITSNTLLPGLLPAPHSCDFITSIHN